jgi:hypothetical protein
VFLVDVAYAAVNDASLYDDGSLAQAEPELMKGVELKREVRFDLHAAAADLGDGDRLEHHHLAAQLSENLDPMSVAMVALHAPRL